MIAAQIQLHAPSLAADLNQYQCTGKAINPVWLANGAGGGGQQRAASDGGNREEAAAVAEANASFVEKQPDPFNS